jgi:hypothetical protein
MMLAMRHSFILLAALVLACGDAGGPDGTTDDTTGGPAPTTGGTAPTTGGAVDGGTVRFTFTISAGARENLKPELPPTGTIHGSIFRAEDVGVTGPIDGAVSIEGVRVEGVDLTTADVSAASFTSGTIAPGEYVFLGFFDLNGNGDTVGEPESGEPATLPTINKFTIETDKALDYVVSFDIVL